MSNEFSNIPVRSNADRGTVDASWWNTIRTALVNTFGSGATLVINALNLTNPKIDGTVDGTSTINRTTLKSPTIDGTVGGTFSFTVPLPIGSGGTGQATAQAARNALLPTQSSNGAKYLQTDGTNATWQAGSISFTAQDKTASYTVLGADDIVFADGTNTDFTVTLPDASTYGKFLRIKKPIADTTLNAITVKRAGTDTIDGGTASLTVVSKGEELLLFPTSTNWRTVHRTIRSVWTSATFTGASSTNTTYTGFWRRVGDSMEISVNIAYSGAPDSGDQRVTVPLSQTIDTAKLDQTGLKILGVGIYRYTSDVTITVEYASTTQVQFRNTGGTKITHNSPHTIASGNSINFIARFPISGWSS